MWANLAAFLAARLDEAAARGDGDPARALREVEAKRAILGRHAPVGEDPVDCFWCSDDSISLRWPCPDVLSIAAIDSDHPDYRPEWAP